MEPVASTDSKVHPRPTASLTGIQVAPTQTLKEACLDWTIRGCWHLSGSCHWLSFREDELTTPWWSPSRPVTWGGWLCCLILGLKLREGDVPLGTPREKWSHLPLSRGDQRKLCQHLRTWRTDKLVLRRLLRHQLTKSQIYVIRSFSGYVRLEVDILSECLNPYFLLFIAQGL